jgi:hypothetical protein
MKIIKTYNQVNEVLYNSYLLTDEQKDWCDTFITGPWKINFDGEVYVDDNKVYFNGLFERFKVKFARCSVFNAANNPKLNSLEGCPDYIKGQFNISNNDSLLSLDGSPKEVGGSYFAISLNIINLKGITKNIGGDLYLTDCFNLKSLDGLDKDFKGQIYARNCGLPQDELIYNWQNDISGDEVNIFKTDWEI